MGRWEDGLGFEAFWKRFFLRGRCDFFVRFFNGFWRGTSEKMTAPCPFANF